MSLKRGKTCPPTDQQADLGDMPDGDSEDKHQLLQGQMLTRLKKIEGQVRGVYGMIEDRRSCGDIVIQLAAIKAAIDRVGITVLGCHMADRIESDLKEGRDLKESLAEFISVFKRFS